MKRLNPNQSNNISCVVACYTNEDKGYVDDFKSKVQKSLGKKSSIKLLYDKDRQGKLKTLKDNLPLIKKRPVLLTDIDCELSFKNKGSLKMDSDVMAGLIWFDSGKCAKLLNLWYAWHLFESAVLDRLGLKKSNAYIYGACVVLSDKAVDRILTGQGAEDIILRNYVANDSLSYALNMNLMAKTDTNCRSSRDYYRKLMKWQLSYAEATSKNYLGDKLSSLAIVGLYLFGLAYLLTKPILLIIFLLWLSLASSIIMFSYGHRHMGGNKWISYLVGPFIIVHFLIDQIYIRIYDVFILLLEKNK